MSLEDWYLHRDTGRRVQLGEVVLAQMEFRDRGSRGRLAGARHVPRFGGGESL